MTPTTLFALLLSLSLFVSCGAQQEINKRSSLEVQGVQGVEGVVSGLLPVCLSVSAANNRAALFSYRGGDVSYQTRQIYRGTFTSPLLPAGVTGTGYGISRKGTVNTVFALDWPNDGGVTLVSSNYCAKDGKYTQTSALYGPQLTPATIGDAFSQVQGTIKPVVNEAYQVGAKDVNCGRGTPGPQELLCRSVRRVSPLTTRAAVLPSAGAPFCFKGPSPGNNASTVVYRLKGGWGPYITTFQAQFYEGYANNPTAPADNHKVWGVAPEGARDLIVVADWAKNGGLTMFLLSFSQRIVGAVPKVSDLNTAILGNAGNALMFSGRSDSATISQTPIPVFLTDC